jgi:hypothetical protein
LFDLDTFAKKLSLSSAELLYTSFEILPQFSPALMFFVTIRLSQKMQASEKY